MRASLFAFLSVFCCGGAACLGDVFTFGQADAPSVTLNAKVLVEAEDGGLLLLGPNGHIWTVQPAQLIKREPGASAFEPLTASGFGHQLSGELGPGFQVWQTRHYVICYNTSREYAKWCGQLFERLYRTFTNYWSRRGFPLHEPEFPLPVLVFADPQSYSQYAQPEVDADPADVPGFYSIRTNRVSFFDLTRAAGARREGDRPTGNQQARRVMASPGGAFTIATVIHEATHQIAFNCGLHTRFAENPLWLTEGMALYFETPDPTNDAGWSKIGDVNEFRLRQFRDYRQRGRPADSLLTLVRDDQRLRDGKLAVDSYAEAWALTYYLVRSRPKQYQAYLQTIQAKLPLVTDSPEQRVAEFQEAFGSVEEVERGLLRYAGGASR